MANVIIDFEFTGLYNVVHTPEIVQVLAMNVDNGEWFITNFCSKTPMTAGALVCCGGVDPTAGASRYFSAEVLYDLLEREIGANPTTDHFYGFNINTDKAVLFNEYGVEFANYTDLNDLCMLNDELEFRMAVEGRSLECVYYMITGGVRTANHGTFAELAMIKTIYDYVVDENGEIKPTNEFLHYVPWGEYAGMTILEYVQRYRRRADGYRFNNDNLFARSMTSEIELLESGFYEDDEFVNILDTY